MEKNFWKILVIGFLCLVVSAIEDDVDAESLYYDELNYGSGVDETNYRSNDDTNNGSNVYEVNYESNVDESGPKLIDDDLYYESFIRLADAGEFPYQVSIHLNDNDKFLCSGTIVSTNKVFAPTQCLHYSWGGIIPSFALGIKTDLTTGNSQYYDVSKVIFHENFDSATMKNDLAVIEISTQFPTDSSTLRAIALSEDCTAKHKNCIVAGRNQETGDLRKVEVAITACFSGTVLTENLSQNDTLCKHALGSSLVCDNTLVGILSVEPNCNTTGGLSTFESVRNALNLLGVVDNSTLSPSSSTPSVETPSLVRLISALVVFILHLFF